MYHVWNLALRKCRFLYKRNYKYTYIIERRRTWEACRSDRCWAPWCASPVTFALRRIFCDCGTPRRKQDWIHTFYDRLPSSGRRSGRSAPLNAFEYESANRLADKAIINVIDKLLPLTARRKCSLNLINGREYR